MPNLADPIRLYMPVPKGGAAEDAIALDGFLRFYKSRTEAYKRAGPNDTVRPVRLFREDDKAFVIREVR